LDLKSSGLKVVYEERRQIVGGAVSANNQSDLPGARRKPCGLGMVVEYIR
jgi:hypothetical protein